MRLHASQMSMDYLCQSQGDTNYLAQFFRCGRTHTL